MIETKKVTTRRALRFESIDDCLADIRRIAAAEVQGTLQTQGNWSAGQVMGHVASWVEYGWEGYPMEKPPWFVRFVMRRMLKGMLKKGMTAGVKIPGIPGGTLGIDEMETQAAASRLTAAFERLKSGEPAKFDSPAFGKMTEAQRIQLNLRHAELHLGFLTYQ